MTISIIVAASTNDVIGRDGGLPWRLPEDLRRFKEITMGKPMIMGRTTWDSIGRALPGRHNIVLTRQAGFFADGCDIAASIDQALALAGDAGEVMIIGGARVYEQFLPLTNRIYLTRVHASVEGDTFFSGFDEREWREVECEAYPADGEREIGFEILTLDRL